MGTDQVVAMDGGGDRHLLELGLHELQDGHLGGGVLHGDAVWTELEIGLAGDQFLSFGVIQMTKEDLFRKGKGPRQSCLHGLEPKLHELINFLEGCRCCFDLRCLHKTFSKVFKSWGGAVFSLSLLDLRTAWP